MSQKRKTEKVKEELRRLAMLPGNKQCMNCQVKGPLYAVIDFNIFVCTFCSAIHRSMQHKVKGITMSEFTEQEVLGLKTGGNERARRIYRHNFSLPPPREGNEREITDLIYRCFVQKIYFNKAEYDAFQRDLENSLNPTTGYSSAPLPQHLQSLGSNSNTNIASTVYQASVIQGPTSKGVISNSNIIQSNNFNNPQIGRKNSVPSSSSVPAVVVAVNTANNNINIAHQQPPVVQQKTNFNNDGAGDFFTSPPANNNAFTNTNNNNNSNNLNNFFTDIPNNRVPVSAVRQQIQRSSYNSISGSSIISGNSNNNNGTSNNSSAITALNGLEGGRDFFDNHSSTSSANWGVSQPSQHQQTILNSQQAAQIQMAPNQFFQTDPIQASKQQVTNASNYQGFVGNNNANFNSNNNNDNAFTDFFSAGSSSLNQNSNNFSNQNTSKNTNNNDFGFFQSSNNGNNFKNANNESNNSFNNPQQRQQQHQQQQQQQFIGDNASKQGQALQFTSNKAPVLDAFHFLDPLSK